MSTSPENSVQARCAGALIGTFVGDALGMPVEGWPPGRIQKAHGRVDEMLQARLGRGTYTDDTQMMIAAGRSLIRCGGLDEEDLAQAFLEHYDPDRGYGGGTRTVLGHLERGVPVPEASKRVFGGEGSYGNGGAMRVASVAVAYHRDRDRLDEVVTRATQITHAHPLGIEGARLQARAIQAALRTPDPTSLDPNEVIDHVGTGLSEEHDHVWEPQLSIVRELLDQGTGEDKATGAGAGPGAGPGAGNGADPGRSAGPGSGKDTDEGPKPRPPTEVASRLGNDSRAHCSVPAALYAALANPASFEEAVVYAVSLGGDTDTIGAMAGAIAGGLHGLSAVPERWWDALENGQDGRDDVVEMGRALADLEAGAEVDHA